MPTRTRPETASPESNAASAAGRERLAALLAARAVRRGDFVLASGRRSKLYVDVKAVFLDPEVLELLADALYRAWQLSGLEVDAVGGMSIGADPLVSAFVLRAWADDRRIPGFIVRKTPKDHGTGATLEGAAGLAEGARVLILEDVVTSGGSSLETAERARQAGFEPVGVIAVVDRQLGARDAILEAGLSFRALFEAEELAGVG